MARKTRIALLLSALLASCGTVDFSKLTPDQLGPAPTMEELKRDADKQLQSVLIDPESRRVRWFDEGVRKAALWGGLSAGWIYGWGMRFGVNAKNRLGGYAGEKVYFVLVTANRVYVEEDTGNNAFQTSK